MDLSERLHSPDLALEPDAGLAATVRRRAARVRRRRRVAGSVLGVVAVVGVAGLVPGLTGAGSDAPLATTAPTYGVSDATSEVVLLERVNGADVVAYFRGDQPCAAATRVKLQFECVGGVSSASVEPFPALFDQGTSALRVDDVQLFGGLVQASVPRVRLELVEGSPVEATTRRGGGFPFPVFVAELPRGAVVTAVVALRADGSELDRRLP